MTKLSLAAGGKKGKPMKFLEAKLENYIPDDPESNIVFKCDELDYYDFPQEEEIPEGIYAAMVVGFQNYVDKFKKHYIDVCYKIFSNHSFIRWNNRTVDKIKYSYIRIRIMKDSDEERKFRVTMSELCNKKKFSLNELIGVITLINIAYRGKGDAIIKKYSSTELDYLWFEDDISDSFHWSTGYTPDEE